MRRGESGLHELVANKALADLLDGSFGWKVRAERTRRVRNRNLRPDIVVDIDGNAVLIEAEHDPAGTLAADVEKVLRSDIRGLGAPIAAVGLKYPPEIKSCDDADLERALAESRRLSYFVAYPDGARFPEAGYVQGSLIGMRTAVRLSSVPKKRIEEGFGVMTDAMEKIARRIGGTDAGVRESVCRSLRQKPSPQTWDMAGLVLLNAATFYEELAALVEGVRPASALRAAGVLPQDVLAGAWRGVLEIDYAPIFESAVEILEALPGGAAGEVIGIMSGAVSKIMALRIIRFGDFYGMLYQNTLSERKHAAAFYTRPEAAVLLAGLLMPPEGDAAWRDAERTEGLRIADFACGSGMLLGAAYGHIVHCSPQDMSGSHARMMERCFYGFDIFPVATHFAVSNMVSTFPDRAFERCNVYTMPIGPGGDGYYLGSLDLIKHTERFAKAGERLGGKGAEETRAASMPPESCDYIIMNPPFVRATNHGGGRADPVPPFAVFGISPEDQIRMGRHNARLYSGTCSHGHAGLASYFMAVCHKKLKPGGSMGLVLPNSMVSGASWGGVRRMLGEWYEDLTLVHAGAGTYSSSTEMRETVLVARKIAGKAKRRQKGSPVRVKSVLLDSMPGSALEAYETARAIRSAEPVRLEDNTGHTSVLVGGDVRGRALDCPVEGDLWWAGRARDTSLLQFVYGLAHGLPGPAPGRASIPVACMGEFARMGRHDLDITGTKRDGTPQGPFNKIPPTANPAYPCLWNNDAERQASMTVSYDCSLERRPGASVRHVDGVWGTASRVHINRQIGYASQRLVAGYTDEPVLGGRSWPNVIMDEPFEKAFAAWCNSTLGVLLYWAAAGSQQPGRGMMSRASFRTVFRTLDVRRLSKRQLAGFDALFDGMCHEELLPINRLDVDPVRRKLDDGVADILGVKIDMDSVRGQIVAEPQFAGSVPDEA